MKIRIEIDQNMQETEIVIRCNKIDSNVQKIQQIIEKETRNIKQLRFYKGDMEYYISLEAILFIETAEGKIQAHTKDDMYQIKYRLYELEEMLPYHFLRISKSTIVNLDKIFSVNRSLASPHSIQFYQSYKQVYVSRYYFKELMHRLEERRKYEI